MAQEFQTSFIPTGKQTSTPSSMIPGGGGRPKKDILGTVLFLVTLVIFIGTALYTGYSVWYEKKLVTQIDALKQELALIKESIVDGEIGTIEKMNNRLKQSSGLLSSHIAPILLFTMLEDETLPTVTFTNFLFEANDQNYQVTAAGKAANFESIVYQSDVFGENSALRDVLFSNLQRTPEGDVTFSFSTFITPESVAYLSRDFSVLDQGEVTEESNPSILSNEQGSAITPEDPSPETPQASPQVTDLEQVDNEVPGAVTRVTPQNANLNES